MLIGTFFQERMIRTCWGSKVVAGLEAASSLGTCAVAVRGLWLVAFVAVRDYDGRSAVGAVSAAVQDACCGVRGVFPSFCADHCPRVAECVNADAQGALAVVWRGGACDRKSLEGAEASPVIEDSVS